VHATNQSLSFIPVSTRKIVTVHDLIEVIEPQSGWGGLASRFLYSGLRGADQLIAVSNYTASTLSEHLGISSEDIVVATNAASADFFSIPDFESTLGYQTLRQELGLAPDDQVVLFVGSDHPRKNVLGALQTFAKVRQQCPNVVFVKVGKPGLAFGRTQSLAEIDRLDLGSSSRIIDVVSTPRLNELYNLADVLLFPSRFEGFGLPPLQAMAAGTPVVASNSTSIPEVMGDTGKMCNPEDQACLVDAVVEILCSKMLASELAIAGTEQAKRFSWEASADLVYQAYMEAS